ncbi:DUF4231 domain-containing protein [Listeria booriae]|uniref:DUF4231 domain-containing protein n=1 Tax=Listeria booriae TaxID=1552123 RepID=UPI001629A479|nr:DUF4231 domain-containing protein [Listeria booriae]MBC1811431.1 DUF4231 domain-containing protein [Listeria booriae]MBC1982655.1 DUF4231 domain-containing protein [Listeria booriae]
MNEETYIKERLEDQIDWYDKKSQSCQKTYKAIKILQMILTGSIPFIVGFIPDLLFMAKIASFFGIVATLLEGYLAIGKYHENWIEYRGICETLRHEKYMFLTKTGVYKEESPFINLVERVESIISSENVNWANLNNDKKG